MAPPAVFARGVFLQVWGPGQGVAERGQSPEL